MNIPRIARQQWRARIETTETIFSVKHGFASPASNGGRGLKRLLHQSVGITGPASPASNGGRGLKLVSDYKGACNALHRPPAMAGAD